MLYAREHGKPPAPSAFDNRVRTAMQEVVETAVAAGVGAAFLTLALSRGTRRGPATGAAQREARMGASGEGGQDYADQLSATGRADRTSEESLAEFGRRLGFKEGSKIAISYMGYALK